MYLIFMFKIWTISSIFAKLSLAFLVEYNCYPRKKLKRKETRSISGIRIRTERMRNQIYVLSFSFCKFFISFVIAAMLSILSSLKNHLKESADVNLQKRDSVYNVYEFGEI